MLICKLKLTVKIILWTHGAGSFLGRSNPFIDILNRLKKWKNNHLQTLWKRILSDIKVKPSFSFKQHWTCKNVGWMSYLKAHNDEDQNDSSDQDFPLLRQLRRRAGVWNCWLVHDWKESWSLTSFISII